jgi:subtilisin family serine protease
MSLGGTSSSKTLQSSVDYAWTNGATLIAAAGNNGNSIAVYPAACQNVVAVSALNAADAIPTWSNFGNYVDISAPGETITTTWPSGKYVNISGTSFSSPIVAGVAGLVLSLNSSLTPSKLVQLLTSTSDDLGMIGYDPYYGSGRVNAARAVSAAVPAVDTTPPTTTVTNPKNGASISRLSSVNVTASAEDNVKVSKIELYINNKLVASSNTASLSYSWKTNKLARGTYTLYSKAYDSSANSSQSTSVTVYR